MLSSLSLFVCALVCGVFWRVYRYILAMKEWVFHLGLAFLRSCFVLCLVLCYHIFVWRVCLFVFFFFLFFCRCFHVHLVVKPSGRGSSGRPPIKSFIWLSSWCDFGGKSLQYYNQVLRDLRQMETLGAWSWPASFSRVSLSLRSLFASFDGGR